jgi:hypothetical protein
LFHERIDCIACLGHFSCSLLLSGLVGSRLVQRNETYIIGKLML